MNIALAKYLGIGLLVVLGAGGALVYFNSSSPASDSQGEAQQSNEEVLAEDGSFSGSLADLMGRGGNWKCEFSHSVNGISSSGTVYVAGASIRGDFSSSVPQLATPVDSHMIQDGGYVYVWSSMMQGRGFKTKSAQGDASSGSAQGGIDVNQMLDYTCAPWAKDASKFALPVGVEFTGN